MKYVILFLFLTAFSCKKELKKQDTLKESNEMIAIDSLKNDDSKDDSSKTAYALIDEEFVSHKLGEEYRLIETTKGTINLKALSLCFKNLLDQVKPNFTEKYIEYEDENKVKVQFRYWSIEDQKSFDLLADVMDYDKVKIKTNEYCEGFYFKNPIHYIINREKKTIYIIAVKTQAFLETYHDVLTKLGLE